MEQLKEADINPELDNKQRRRVKGLLWEFQDSFINNLAEISYSNIIEYEINLKPGVKLFYYPGIYYFMPLELEAIKENLKEELKTRKIIKYNRPWCALIILAKKKNRKLHKCMAYNRLNDRIKHES